MRISSKLNIVVEVVTEEDGTIFVHSTPISRDVFERYFMIIGKTFATIIGEGLTLISGPRVAAMLLKKVAADAGVWDGPGGVEQGLMAEIRRLSSVVMPGPNGWKTLPLQDAISKKLLSDEDIAEVEGLLVFFICVSAMSRKTELLGLVSRLSVWGTQTTSLNSTEFAGSLQISTPDETSSSTASTSSVPH